MVIVLCSLAYLVGWYMGRHKATSWTAEEDPRAALIGEKQHRHEKHMEPMQQMPEEQTAQRLSYQTYKTREVHHLYEAFTVGELRDLLVERGVRLKAGYTRKEELVELASTTSPAEMEVITRLTNELKDYGIDVRWQARMLASGRRIKKMLHTTAEVVNHLRERFS